MGLDHNQGYTSAVRVRDSVRVREVQYILADVLEGPHVWEGLHVWEGPYLADVLVLVHATALDTLLRGLYEDVLVLKTRGRRSWDCGSHHGLGQGFVEAGGSRILNNGHSHLHRTHRLQEAQDTGTGQDNRVYWTGPVGRLL